MLGNIPGMDVHWGLVVGIICCIGAWVLIFWKGWVLNRARRDIDRALVLAEKWQVPVVVFAEGGGIGLNDEERARTFSISPPAVRICRSTSSLILPEIGSITGYRSLTV